MESDMKECKEMIKGEEKEFNYPRSIVSWNKF